LCYTLSKMNNRLSKQTFYEILEVSPDATQQDIHTAYQKAKAAYSLNSPSLYSTFTLEEAHQLMHLIEEAFTVLSDPSRRNDYDKQLIKSNNSSASPHLALTTSTTNLPDFQPPSSSPGSNSGIQGASAMAHSLKISKKEPLPEGFGKTRFSVYEVDQAFEDEIATTTLFDGTFLQKVRLYKHVNLEQMSEDTRISRTYLRAVESNDYDALPAAVFVRGFIVQFARILGLNEKQVVDSYMTLYRNAKQE